MDENLFHGTCVGGPMDGKYVAVRTPGFLATDRGAGKAWIYKHRPNNTFTVCTDHDDSLVYPGGTVTGERTIDWDRLPLTADLLGEIKLGDGPEAESGDPVEDGWVNG